MNQNGGLVKAPRTSSEIGPQGVGDDLTSSCQVIPNDQAQGFGTISSLVEHPNVPISSIGAVGVNQRDGEGGCFGLSHLCRLN